MENESDFGGNTDVDNLNKAYSDASNQVNVDKAQVLNSTSISISEELSKQVNSTSGAKVVKAEFDIKDNFGTTTVSRDCLIESMKLAKQLEVFIGDTVGIESDNGEFTLIPTGIDILDAILGGGFAIGTFNMIAGNPGTFKSSICARTLGNAQRMFRQKFLATYIDNESSMSAERMFDMGMYAPVKPYTQATVEKVFKFVEAHSAFKVKNNILEYPSAIVWDSIANTPTEKESADEENDPSSSLGLKARILSLVFPKYIPKMRKFNILVLAVNQLRDKIDMGVFKKANDLRFMGDKNMPGGMAPKFNAFHLLMLSTKRELDADQYGFGGIQVEAKLAKNKLFAPNIPVTLVANYQKGFSNFWTNYNFLVDCKMLQSGAWNKLLSFPDKTFRTKEAENIYLTDENFKQHFDEDVKKAININIIEPNKNKRDDFSDMLSIVNESQDDINSVNEQENTTPSKRGKKG